MENRTEDQVIYPKDLLFAALHRWKRMLAAALVFAVVLGGYQAVAGMRSLSADARENAQEEYEEAVEAYEIDKALLERTVGQMEEDIKNQQVYLEDSIYLQLDPYGYYEVSVIAYVDAGYQIQPDKAYQDTDPTGPILGAYYTAMNELAVLDALAQVPQCHSRFVREIYHVETSVDNQTLTIHLKYPDKEGTQELLQVVLEYLEATKASIASTIGEHELHLLEQDVSSNMDLSLLEVQRNAESQLRDMTTLLEQAEEELQELDEPALTVSTIYSVLKKVVLFAAIGAVLGAALIAVWAWLAHAVSTKVYSARTLRVRTGAKLLGCMALNVPKNPIDRKLRAWEGRELSSAEERAAVLALDVANRVGAAKTLLVTGDSNAEARAVLVQALQNAMPGVTVSDCGSLLRCTNAVSALASTDSVLLVVQCGSSLYGSVNAEMDMVRDYGKSLLGCVLLGG
ncbi:MAG: hypothetical protein IJX67_08640 [Oscillospiraceae bacterium]|nr:hypothetical protein [Oscillospiraceae bacterium]